MPDTITKPVIFLAFANDRDDAVGYLRNLPDEARRLRDATEAAEQAGLCEVVIRSNSTADDIFKVFQNPKYRNRIAIFHYSGHANGYQLLLESTEGKVAAADAGGLATFLAQQQGLQLVFLNGCSTQQQTQALHDANVAVVISTSRSIDDKVATDFADIFYRSLASGADLLTAYHEATAAIKMVKSGDLRALYFGNSDKPEDHRNESGFPWNLYSREGSENAAQWNLPEAVGNVLFGLPPLPKQDLPASPYRHLNWFTRKDAEVFFGRGNQIRELYHRLTAPRTAPIILFYGQSGVGKSSILDAGLIPRLERDHEVRYLRRTAGGLLDTLQLAFLPEASEVPVETAWRVKEEQTGKPLIVFLDQVEELYTRPIAELPDELAQLLKVVNATFVKSARRPRGKLVLGFRKEWLAELEAQLTASELPRTKVFLEPLDRRGIIEVVEGPARSARLREHYGLTVQDDLAEVIADDLLEDRDSAIAPTLQILLTKLWTKATDANYEHPQFRQDVYRHLKRDGILLRDFLNQQIAAFRQRYPEAVDSGLLLDIVALHTTPLGTADQRSVAELQQQYAHLGATLPDLLQQCQDLHLLTVAASSQKESSRTTRLAHDTLAPLVREQFEVSDKPGQRARRILDNRSVDWESGCDGTPLDGADLAIVEKGASGTRVMSPTEQRLLMASRELRDRLERNRRILKIGGALAFAVIAGLGAWGWWQRGKAVTNFHQAETAKSELAQKNEDLKASITEVDKKRNEAEQSLRRAYIENVRRLVSQSESRRETSPPLAVLLASEALKLAEEYQLPANAANDSLRNAVASCGGRILAARHKGSMNAVAISRDGRWLATAGDDKTVLLWDLNAGDPCQTEATVLDDHSGPINAVAISADSHWLATASDDTTARLWDLTSQNPSATAVILAGHHDRIHTVALSPDNRWLVTASDDTTARRWDLAADDPATTGVVLEGHNEPLRAAAISEDSRMLVTGSKDNTARCWDLTTEAPSTLATLTHPDDVWSVAISPDGQLVATGSEDRNARLWNLSLELDPPIATILSGHKQGIYSVTFSPDGRWLVTASDDNTARRWDATAADPPSTGVVLDGHRERVSSVSISADSRWLVSAGDDRTSRLWDLNKDNPSRGHDVMIGHEGPIRSVAISPDSDWLVTASVDGTARRWKITNEGLLGNDVVLKGHTDLLLAVAISSDNRWLVSAGKDHTARRWDLTSADPPSTGVELVGHQGSIVALGISPDSHWLVTAGRENVARRWELTATDASTTAVELNGHSGSISSVAISSDGRWLVTASTDRTARLWNLTAADPSATSVELTGHAGLIYSVAIGSNGRWLATASEDNTARLWDLTAANPSTSPIVLRGHQGQVFSVAISPASRWLATASDDKTARLWDLTANDPSSAVIVLKGHEADVNSVVFSRDNRWLVTVSDDETSRLWDLTTNDVSKSAVVLGGHQGKVVAAAFSVDNRWLATACGDQTLLWDLTRLDPTTSIVLRGHEGLVYAVAISPDGRWLATASDDTCVRLWPLSPEQLFREAERVAGRNLHIDEWNEFFSGTTYKKTFTALLDGFEGSARLGTD